MHANGNGWHGVGRVVPFVKFAAKLRSWKIIVSLTAVCRDEARFRKSGVPETVVEYFHFIPFHSIPFDGAM